MRTIFIVFIILFISLCSCGRSVREDDAPVVTGITNTDTSGGIVTILGRNFGTNTSLISIVIDEKECNVTSVSEFQNVTYCSIGPGTGTSKSVVVQVNGVRTVQDNVRFNYNAPAVNSATSVYSIGGVVTIVGNNFGNENSVINNITIGGIPCTSPTLTEPQTTITCTLASGGSGKGLSVIVYVDGQPSGGNTVFSYLDATCSTACGSNAACVAPDKCACNQGFSGDGQTCEAVATNSANGAANAAANGAANGAASGGDGGNGATNGAASGGDGANGNGGGDGGSANGALNIPHNSKSNTGTIIGAVVGSVGGLLLIGLLVFLIHRRRNRRPPTPEFVIKGAKTGKVFGLERLGTGWEQQEARRLENERNNINVQPQPSGDAAV
eukprot:TRINITY_DN17231_c0_g1_i1.p1 TRINITY_DN17231_c0_g1~~TRINITY_DN17231_c0_g1_i1.p1  ORF type:complete len:384 (-),score=111.34 TRINITY_DN17231_c0_g1_i1:40-1191(-)